MSVTIHPNAIETLDSAYAPYVDLLDRLGGIEASRLRLDPPPGQATLDDLIAVNESGDGPICEWIEGSLVEKAMGQFESWLAQLIVGKLYNYLETNDLGMLLGEAGVLRILPRIGRAADVTFIAWTTLPDARPPPRENRVPELVPDLVIEVRSHSNTPAEIARKRGEYLRAGVKLIWEIDPKTRTAVVYQGAQGPTAQGVHVPADGTLDGADILPGFTLSLHALFERAGRAGPGR